jgi:hypothetical protein
VKSCDDFDCREKKLIYAAERDLERVRARRSEYQTEIALELLARLKFLDAAGSNIAMTRLYGRAAPGANL